MNEDKKESFWSTLPGILTGLAALIGAIGGIVTVVLTSHGSGGNSSNSGTGSALISSGSGGSGSSGGGSGAAVSTSSGPTLAQWASDANDICSQFYDQIRVLGVTDPAAQFQAIPQITAIVADGNAKIQALDRPAGNEEQINHLVEVGSQANVAPKNAYDSQVPGRGVRG